MIEEKMRERAHRLAPLFCRDASPDAADIGTKNGGVIHAAQHPQKIFLKALDFYALKLYTVNVF